MFVQHFEESGQKRGKLSPVDGPVPIDIEEIKEIFNIVLSGGLSSNQIDDSFDDRWELFFCEWFVVIFVELGVDLFEESRDIFLCEFPLGFLFVTSFCFVHWLFIYNHKSVNLPSNVKAIANYWYKYSSFFEGCSFTCW